MHLVDEWFCEPAFNCEVDGCISRRHRIPNAIHMAYMLMLLRIPTVLTRPATGTCSDPRNLKAQQFGWAKAAPILGNQNASRQKQSTIARNAEGLVGPVAGRHHADQRIICFRTSSSDSPGRFFHLHVLHPALPPKSEHIRWPVLKCVAMFIVIVLLRQARAATSCRCLPAQYQSITIISAPIR